MPVIKNIPMRAQDQQLQARVNSQGEPICGAQLRNKPGRYCQRTKGLAIKGRCRMHGGASLVGEASPHFKDGSTSKYIPAHMREHWDVARFDPEPLSVRKNLDVIQARIYQLQERIGTNFNECAEYWKQAKDGLREMRQARQAEDKDAQAEAFNKVQQALDAANPDYLAFDKLGEQIDLHRKLAESEQKRLDKSEQNITLDRAMMTLAALVEIIRTEVTDKQTMSRITIKYNQLIDKK